MIVTNQTNPVLIPLKDSLEYAKILIDKEITEVLTAPIKKEDVTKVSETLRRLYGHQENILKMKANYPAGQGPVPR